jgi:hypothetical protein
LRKPVLHLPLLPLSMYTHLQQKMVIFREVISAIESAGWDVSG